MSARVTRLRWRLRGATMWPAFALVTITEGVLFDQLPFDGEGPGGLFPSLLLATACNLAVIAVAAPLAGMAWRRHRRDLPRQIATDQAGTVLITVLLAVFVAGGALHHDERVRDERAQSAALVQTSIYVHNQARDYLADLHAMDVIKIDAHMYRTCVPGPKLPLCLFVTTDQSPPGVSRDPDRTPNALYRR